MWYDKRVATYHESSAQGKACGVARSGFSASMVSRRILGVLLILGTTTLRRRTCGVRDHTKTREWFRAFDSPYKNICVHETRPLAPRGGQEETQPKGMTRRERNVRTHEHTFRYSDIQIFRYSDIQIFRRWRRRSISHTFCNTTFILCSTTARGGIWNLFQMEPGTRMRQILFR